MTKKFLGIGLAIFVLPFLYLGISFKVTGLIIFSVFIIFIYFWYAYVETPYTKIDKNILKNLNYLKITKYALISFLEIFVIYTFTNVILFSNFRFQNMLRFSYFSMVI